MNSLLLKPCSRDGKKRKPIVLCTPLESRWPLRMIVRALLLCLYVNAKGESAAPNFPFADFEFVRSVALCHVSRHGSIAEWRMGERPKLVKYIQSEDSRIPRQTSKCTVDREREQRGLLSNYHDKTQWKCFL